MTEAIISSGPKPPTQRFSRLTAWALKAPSTPCWRALDGLQLSVGFTDPFYDIDVGEDLTRLAAELQLAPSRAPRTASWLKQWGQAVAQLRSGTENL